ncbi:MAG: glycosyltransferase family 1 protein, partial [Patescibacteria group bacterium]
VEWYSRHLINCLLKEISASGSEDEVILYSREKLDLSGNKVLSGQRFWTLGSLSKEMSKNPPDVLFVPSHVLPLNLPKRSVITIHDVAFKHLKNSYSFSQYHYLNWSTKFAVKKATKIIVPSEATKEDLIKFFQCPVEKIVVIPHGFEAPAEVDDETVLKDSVVFKYFGITKVVPYILFVGRLESKKNLVRLVEAFKKFAESQPDYRLILAGKRGVGFEQILKTVNKLELMHKVIMPGYITEEEKAALYKHAKIFAFPSLYEGFGLPVLESFYYQKPVLCSNVSALTEVGGDAVHYVDPHNIEEMAEGLKKITTDQAYAQTLIAKGLKRLKMFSWENSAKKTLWTIMG